MERAKSVSSPRSGFTPQSLLRVRCSTSPLFYQFTSECILFPVVLPHANAHWFLEVKLCIICFILLAQHLGDASVDGHCDEKSVQRLSKDEVSNNSVKNG